MSALFDGWLIDCRLIGGQTRLLGKQRTIVGECILIAIILLLQTHNSIVNRKEILYLSLDFRHIMLLCSVWVTS
jgi:hypothetical protein